MQFGIKRCGPCRPLWYWSTSGQAAVLWLLSAVLVFDYAVLP